MLAPRRWEPARGRPRRRLPVLRARGDPDRRSRRCCPLFDRTPELRRRRRCAIVMEPTDNALGGRLPGQPERARTDRAARAAHSARPWLGDNAIHAAIEALAPIADLPIRRRRDRRPRVPRGGRASRRSHGGVAGNVVPDRVEATRELPLRADTRARRGGGAAARAARRIRGSRSTVVGNAPPGPCACDNPLRDAAAPTGGSTFGPKQAWTPVAEFATIGVDAVNFGPGDPRYAHRDDEQVDAATRSCGAARGPVGVPGRRRRLDGRICHPAIRAVEPYPFEELDRRKADAVDAAGRELIDFGVGDPREETPALIREALAGGDQTDLVVPARGRVCPELRRCDRRLGGRAVRCGLDPDARSSPTARFEGARVLARAGRARSRRAARTSCSTTAPGYPIPERGARYAGGDGPPPAACTEQRGLPAGPRRRSPTTHVADSARCG